jgi:Tfp pilus assembly protein PilN
LKQGFNFLKPQVEPPSPWSRIYDWVVGTARAILILFEIAVVIALGVRIVVDVQSKNIDEQISTLETIMSQRALEEQKYRNLQIKTGAYATLWTTGQIYSEIFDLINQYIPPTAVEFNVNLEGDIIRIDGKASNADIKQMENGLKQSNLFKDTKLTILEVASDDPNFLSKFSFTSKVQNPKFRQLYDPNSVLESTEPILEENAQ